MARGVHVARGVHDEVARGVRDYVHDDVAHDVHGEVVDDVDCAGVDDVDCAGVDDVDCAGVDDVHFEVHDVLLGDQTFFQPILSALHRSYDPKYSRFPFIRAVLYQQNYNIDDIDIFICELFLRTG